MKVLLTGTQKQIDRNYDKLFSQIDKASSQSNQSGFCNDSEQEYKTENGYVVEFRFLRPTVIEWIESQKNIAIA